MRASDDLLEPCANEGGTFREPVRRPFESTLRQVREHRTTEQVTDLLVKAGIWLGICTIVGLIVKIIFKF